MGSIKEWVRYHTGVWNDEHDKIVLEIAKKLVWYRPGVYKRILKEVEEGLNHVKSKKEKNDEQDI